MGIAEYIRDDILKPRLKSECLVVYDVDERYRDICLDLATEQVTIIDVSGSSIESREHAQAAFLSLAKGELKGMIIYIPEAAPSTDEQRQKDPFSVYVQCGSQFPKSDGDEYFNLCLKAKPEHNTEIRRIFQDNPNPPLAAIDAVGGGIHWPQLRSTLQADSTVDLLIAFLIPTDDQKQALKTQPGWLPEAKDFFKATLGLTLKTRARTWSPIADELWRFVLFSEFVFDLPVALPSALEGVPRAPKEAEPIVCDLCERLRNDQRYQDQYLERAEAIEADLSLPSVCADIEDLGKLNTFPFEERTFLRKAVQGIVDDSFDVTRQLLTRHSQSIWRTKGENQEQWSLIQAALTLIVICEDFNRLLPDFDRSQDSLVNFYVERLRQVDQRQREFEETVGNAIIPSDDLDKVIDIARKSYRTLMEQVQGSFIRHLEKDGWPVAGRLSNAEVFKRFLTPRLSEKGRRIAYLMIDALRYELGVELEKLLTEVGIVEMHTACAQLPTITPVGMASLLPDAHSKLTLDFESSKLVPKIDNTTVSNVAQRMGYLRKQFGDRFAEMTLRDFVKKKKLKLESTIDLLVLRSTEIDSQLESNPPEDTLGLIPKTLKQIRVALAKLGDLGFHEAVIASDHGFYLNAQAGPGDVCKKPQGHWSHTAHDRMLMGNGTADGHNVIFSTDKLGIRSNMAQAAVPKTMAPYKAGYAYFHGGASLAEAIIPVLLVRLEQDQPEGFEQFQIELSYKRGSKRITTRLPRINVALSAENLFAQAGSCEILLEAQDTKGEVIGEPRPSEDVNPATRTITLFSQEAKQIVLRMDPAFEGKFTVKALDPNTLRIYASLNLETDYTV